MWKFSNLTKATIELHSTLNVLDLATFDENSMLRNTTIGIKKTLFLRENITFIPRNLTLQVSWEYEKALAAGK